MKLKKHLSLLLVVVILALALTSCSAMNGNAKTVSVEDSATYRAVYLYSFRSADITDDYTAISGLTDEQKNSLDNPSEYGYKFSTTKYEIGDEIKVWNEYSFKTDRYSSTTGAEAIVDEIVATYYVKVSGIGNRYTISGYSIGDDVFTYRDQPKVDVLTEFKVSAPADKVVISYDVE